MAPSVSTEDSPNGRVVVVDLTKSKENGHVNGESQTNGHKHTNGDADKSEDGKPAEDDKKLEITTEAKDGDAVSSSPDADAKDTAEEEAKVEDETMKCEIKHLDRRWDDKDETYFEERKTEVTKPKQKDWWRLFAFCMVRQYDSEGDLDTTKLYVNPQPLRQLLYDVIGHYASDPIDVNDVQIESPYSALFHYRKPLERKGLERFDESAEKPDPESLAQLKLLLEWIDEHFKDDIAAHARCFAAEHKAIAFEKLWTLFPPTCIIHSKLLGQNRAFRVLDSWYDLGELPGLSIKVQFIDFDGERLGTRKTELFIPKYTGIRELAELNIMPLNLLVEADEVRQELLDRGRRFEGFVGQHYMQYEGIALKRAQAGYARFSVNGRVMIDCKTYHRLDANDTFTVQEMGSDEVSKRARAKRKANGVLGNFADGVGGSGGDADGEKKYDRLEDEDALLCNATVRGYAFSVKRFLEFFVDKLEPIVWNTSCFDELVLDAGTKKTVRALVSTHSKKPNRFDDIVKGKGQGIVCVLHGPPGVGKTLTAECVAEYVQRPLYMVSSGDLGVSSSELDSQLTRVMDMTQTWRAVLLIDEADVFLERRSLHDLHRNAMVSVFLRVLEYYSGILFLTTNRVNTFDDAFKSRIHIPIRYTDLNVSSRKQIWSNFLRKVPAGVDVDEAGIALLAEHDLNGRQIKNVIKAAESLAAYDDVKLDLEQLQQVTKIQALFEKDLTNLNGVDYTAPGSSRKDADSRNMFL